MSTLSRAVKRHSSSDARRTTFATFAAAAGSPPTTPAPGGSTHATPSSSAPTTRPNAAAAERQWFKFATAKAETGPARATLHVYDVIGADPFFGGVDVNEAVTMIDGLDDAAELAVRINSPGGAAWDGLTLANAII
jgi:ClpP class serine protease